MICTCLQRVIIDSHIKTLSSRFSEGQGVVREKFELFLYVSRDTHPDEPCHMCAYFDNFAECRERQYCAWTGQHRNTAYVVHADATRVPEKRFTYRVLGKNTPEFVKKWLLEQENNLDMAQAESTLLQVVRIFDKSVDPYCMVL